MRSSDARYGWSAFCERDRRPRRAPKEITWQLGVDDPLLGGTKNGLGGRTGHLLWRELAAEFGAHAKQAGQLASKMRFYGRPMVRSLAERSLAP